MKNASPATQAILAAGQYLKFEFYEFQLPGGTYYFTDADTPLTAATYGTSGFGPAIGYQSNLIIKRGAITQKVGLEVQSLDLTVAPQFDANGGQPLIGGVSFMSACRAGLFDAGILTHSRGFFNRPAPGTQLDTSPGLVLWNKYFIDEVQAGRHTVEMTLHDVTQILNIQMPRIIVESGCTHTLFDSGCTLLKSAFTSTGTVASASSASLTSGLTQADGYFNLGRITFTSGALLGSTYVVSQYKNASGTVTPIIPFVTAPASGDTFSIVPGCDKAQATCSGKFNNLAHYAGAPFVPQPETLYDGGTGGTASDPVPPGLQGGRGVGTQFNGSRGYKTYNP